MLQHVSRDILKDTWKGTNMNLEDIRYIGTKDFKIDLFEGMFKVSEGMIYNSYLIEDEKIAVLDTVDKEFGREWMEKLQKELQGRRPDYLIVQHMEPDHSANILLFTRTFPEAVIVSSKKAFQMMEQFFGQEIAPKRMVVAEGEELNLGKHCLIFIEAPMVHWPEVIMTYDTFTGALFSADAFGKFGTKDSTEDWLDEARRYYFGIVSKYGIYVQKLLEKAAKLDIKVICPLHGPILDKNIVYYLRKYETWAAYESEIPDILIAYTSVYGNTKEAVEYLEKHLLKKGCRVQCMDLCRCDIFEAVAQAFSCSTLVLATTTYNAGVFPAMRKFIEYLLERNYCKRRVGLIENGSWAITAARLMEEMLKKGKEIEVAENRVRIVSALNEDSKVQLDRLADELHKHYLESINQTDFQEVIQ